MDLELFVTPGLGDASYLLASGGEAVLVDPQRDAWRFLEVAGKRGWRVRYVLETHVHNDYLSGAIEARAATGAEIAAPARGGYTFEHRPMDEGDAVEIGGLRLTAWATPGHTPEHLSWAVHDLGADDPIGVFTGGSLLVGSAGRTDLLGAALTDALTRDQQRTLQRLATLPDATEVLPTHGAGSFCSAGPGSAKRVSTIAAERLGNPTFGAASEAFEAFRAQANGGLGRYPAYYAQMAPINRAGPRVLGRLTLPPPLDAAAFEAAASAGATIVDARDRAAFAAGHIRGALNIELDGTFAGYVGWLVPFASKVILVLPEGSGDAAEAAATELLRIGYEWVPGFLDGGMDAWAASGREVATYDTTTMDDARDAQADGEGRVLLDVRQPIEWQQDGVVPGAERIFVADLPARIAELQGAGAPVTVFCKSGSRAAIAASMLDAAGVDVRVVTEGGAAKWPEPLELLPPL
ncbi:MAG TPA: MBL fold metallo-hydrolase [Candidatus Limnocylindrales bacterium]|nr:MBL fold metallo-hydrolase [Candidatus Limnocylindrales bacterium]